MRLIQAIVLKMLHFYLWVTSKVFISHAINSYMKYVSND